MKIWLVIRTDYFSDLDYTREIEKAFSSEEKAKEYLSQHDLFSAMTHRELKEMDVE